MKKLSVRQTESLVKNIKSGNKKSTRSSDVSRIYIDVTNKFETFFNSKVTIKENSSGKISLSAIFDDINKLYSLGEVNIPKYNFQTHCRERNKINKYCSAGRPGNGIIL